MKTFLAVVVVALVIGLAVFGVMGAQTLLVPAATASFIAECKQQFTRQLRSPTQAEYGSIHDVAGAASFARTLDRHGFVSNSRRTVWLATIDAPNAFGTSVRSYAVCYRLRGDTRITAVMTSNTSDIDFLID